MPHTSPWDSAPHTPECSIPVHSSHGLGARLATLEEKVAEDMERRLSDLEIDRAVEAFVSGSDTDRVSRNQSALANVQAADAQHNPIQEGTSLRIFEELCAVPAVFKKEGLCFAVTKEPSWIEALRNDMQSMIKNALSDVYLERTSHFANTAEMHQPPISNDRSFSLLQEIISEIRSLRSVVLGELRVEGKVLGTHHVVAPASPQVGCVHHCHFNRQHSSTFVSEQYTGKEATAPAKSQVDKTVPDVQAECAQQVSLPVCLKVDCVQGLTESTRASEQPIAMQRSGMEFFSGSDCGKMSASRSTKTNDSIKDACNSSLSMIKFARLRKRISKCRTCKEEDVADYKRESTPGRLALAGEIFGRLDRSVIRSRVRESEFQFGSNGKLTRAFTPDPPGGHGFMSIVADHPAFHCVTVAVIILNSVFVAIDMDMNKAKSAPEVDTVYIFADFTFFIFFALELLIRFMALMSKYSCFSDAWFLFDSALLALYALDPFVLGLMWNNPGVPTSFLRLLRLARLSRVCRLFFRIFPELIIMIQAMFTALASVGYATALLALGTYVVSVAIRSLVPDNSQIERLYFSNVFRTMHHLILHGAFMDDLGHFVENIYEDSMACVTLVWFYIVVTALLLMNMLIGIICEVVSAASTQENETMVVQNAKKKFTKILASFDHDRDGHLTWDEFAQVLQDGACQDLMSQFHVDIDAFVDLAEDSFEEGRGEEIQVSYRQFIELILDLRWSQAATVKDVMVISKRMNSKFDDLKSCLESVVCNKPVACI